MMHNLLTINLKKKGGKKFAKARMSKENFAKVTKNQQENL